LVYLCYVDSNPWKKTNLVVNNLRKQGHASNSQIKLSLGWSNRNPQGTCIEKWKGKPPLYFNKPDYRIKLYNGKIGRTLKKQSYFREKTNTPNMLRRQTAETRSSLNAYVGNEEENLTTKIKAKERQKLANAGRRRGGVNQWLVDKEEKSS